MSVESILEIIGLTFTALVLFAGGVWWMSMLYSKVGSIQINTKATSTKLDTLTEKMDSELHYVKHEQYEHLRAIGDLRVRVAVLEDTIDTDEE